MALRSWSLALLVVWLWGLPTRGDEKDPSLGVHVAHALPGDSPEQWETAIGQGRSPGMEQAKGEAAESGQEKKVDVLDILRRLNSTAAKLRASVDDHRVTVRRHRQAHDSLQSVTEAMAEQTEKDAALVDHLLKRTAPGEGDAALQLVAGGEPRRKVPAGYCRNEHVMESAWETASLQEYLSHLGLERYEPLLVREGFNSIAALRHTSPFLSESTLVNLGIVSPVHRELLVSEVAKLRKAVLTLRVLNAHDLPAPPPFPNFRKRRYSVKADWAGTTRQTPFIEGPSPSFGGHQLTFPPLDVANLTDHPLRMHLLERRGEDKPTVLCEFILSSEAITFEPQAPQRCVFQLGG